MISELFRSENLSVRAVPCADLTTWVVTFDHYNNEGGLDRTGFGEDFFKSLGISAVHFICSGNDWFQYDDLSMACRVAREALADADRIMAYGSSMGAYAAIRLADAVGADCVLALAPQYSIDPRKVPWECRWQQDGARISWLETVDGPIRCASVPIVVFDPWSDDLRHVERIENDIEIARIAVPLSGHPVTTYLSDTGLLTPLFLAALDPVGDPAALMKNERDRRKTSAFYLAELARKQPERRLRTANALAERAVAIQEGPLPLFGLAHTKTRAGRYDEAFAVYERIMVITDRDASYICPYADARYAAGDLPGALLLANEVVAAFPDRAHLLNWRATFLWDMEARSEALEDLRRAIQLDPSPAYIERLAALRALAEAAPAPLPERAPLRSRPGLRKWLAEIISRAL